MYSFLLNVGTQKDSVMHCIVVLSFRSVVYFLSYHFLIIRFIIIFFPRVVSGSSRIAFLKSQDKYAGKCFDSWWWAPPSCRGDTSKCVPHITGGTGWQSEAMMQKTTLFNMPIASAVAASYGDYTTLPQAGNMIFYWWTPDPTFLELSPMVVKFPEFKSQEFQQGVLTSESAAAVVSALSSRDLEILAPVVERFVDGVDLPVSEMDTMLLDHKNRDLDYSEASWRNVTCTWLRNNRAMWQTWIPDESVCYPGFGLYDAVLDQFTDDRNVTNKIVCQVAWQQNMCTLEIGGFNSSHDLLNGMLW